MDSTPAHLDSAAAADAQAWRCEAVPADIQFAPNVLQAIRSESVEGLLRLGRGGIEYGGILFGLRTADSIRVLGSRSFPCEHRFGPSFLVSDKDEAQLQEMIDPANQPEELRGLEAIGWYVSHCRRGAALAESDLRLSNQHFPKPGALTVVLLPERTGRARASIFVRDAKGVLDPEVCSREMTLRMPEPPAPMERESPLPATLTATGPPMTLPLTPPDSAAPQNQVEQNAIIVRPQQTLSEDREEAFNRLRAFLQQQEKHRRISSWNLLVTVGLLVAAVGTALYLWTRPPAKVQTPPAVVLHVSEVGSHLRIDWDPELHAVQTATGGELDIREGDGESVAAKLDVPALRNGSAVYNHSAANVEVRLRLFYPDSPQVESVVYLINPAAPAPESVTPGQPKAAQTDQPPTTVVEPSQPPKEPVIARTFEPPRMAVKQQAPVVLNTTPSPGPLEIEPKAPALPFAVPAAAPPPPAPAPPVEHAGPRSGRLIWTGDLARDALLTLTASKASTGWVNGKLPGFPVTITAHVARLVAGGLEVYTDNEKRAETPEAPSAENGWNTVVYKYDAKGGPDVRILDAPRAENGWSQIVLQNGKRPVSVIVFDWRRADGPAASN